MSTTTPHLPCRFYAKGICRYGNKCRFSHAGTGANDTNNASGSHENKSPQAASQPQYRQMKIKKGQRPCFAWRRGHCSRGDKCWYAHDPAERGMDRRQGVKAGHSNDPKLSTNEPPRDEAQLVDAAPLKEEVVGGDAETELAGITEEEKKRLAMEAELLAREEARKRAEEEEQRRKLEAERLAHEEELRILQARVEKLKAERRAFLVTEAARLKVEAEQFARLKEARQGEEAAFILQRVINGSIVTFASGLEVRGVITGFESCLVTVKNIPADARPAEIKDLFIQQGLDITRFHLTDTKRVANGKVEVSVITDAETGTAMALGLDELPFRNENLAFEVGFFNGVEGMGTFSNRSANVVVLSFRAPPVQYSVELPEAIIATKIQELNGRTFSHRQVTVERSADAAPSSRWSWFPSLFGSITISNLPFEVTDAAVVLFAGNPTVRRLQPLGSYATLDPTLSPLRNLISAYLPDQLRSFDIMPRENQDNDILSVRIHLSSHEAARRAFYLLREQCFNLIGIVPSVRLGESHLFAISIPLEQYKAQKKQWKELHDSITDRNACDLRFHELRSIVRIEVTGKVQAATGILKVRVENLSSGERVEGWHRMLCLPNKDFMEEIAKTGAYFSADHRRQTLKLYGSSRKIAKARKVVANELERLSRREWIFTIARSSIGFFMRQGLSTLQEMFGEDCVRLDTARRRLTVHGSEEAHHEAARLIELSEQPQYASTSQLSATCPICTEAVSLPHELGCGHEYCTACLRHFLTTAVETKSFPLRCIGDSARCAVPIPIPLIQRFLPLSSFDLLVEGAFNTYIARHPDEIKNCTTPTCMQIYRKSEAPNVVQCPSCFVELCSACGMGGHNGLTCAEYRTRHDPTEQERLSEQWIAGQASLKKCPRCTRLLEKISGCNHVLCPCGAHICWQCMGVFHDNEIYRHMHTAHGGFFAQGAPPAAGAAPQQDPFLGANYAEQVRLMAQAQGGEVEAGRGGGICLIM